MVEDKEQYKKSIRFFNDREVRAVWDEEHCKWWFSVLDIIAAINEQDDYQKTRNYWKYLKTKLRKENSRGCVKMYTSSFLCTKPRLSQARALLFPKVFVPLGIKKISL